MKVFIAGATGVLGSAADPATYRARPLRVWAGPQRKVRKHVQALGGNPRHADLFDAESLARQRPAATP